METPFLCWRQGKFTFETESICCFTSPSEALTWIKSNNKDVRVVHTPLGRARSGDLFDTGG